MNTIRSILVHMDAGSHTTNRLRVGRQLGERLQAEVMAFYAVTPVMMELPLDAAAEGYGVDVLMTIDDGRIDLAYRKLQLACAGPGPAVAWQVSRGMPVPALVRQAFCCDLLVLGQREPQKPTSGVPADFVELVLLACGKPALVVPYIAPPARVGHTVLVAWKECAEAARAVQAALPLLQAAHVVHVLDGSEPADEESPNPGIAAYLRRHGVHAECRRAPDEGIDAGSLLLSTAADLSADLLVMGCYGHSRVRELVLGGATRTVLQSMTLPVLMAH